MPGGDILARNVLRTLIVVVFGVTVALYVLAPLWGPPIGFSGDADVLRETVIWAGLSGVTSVALGLLRAEDRLSGFILVSVLQSVGPQVAGLGVVAASGGGARSYLLGIAGAQGVTCLLAVLLIRPFRLSATGFTPVLKVARFSLPLVVGSLAAYLYSGSDRIVINAELGARAVARYQVSYNLAGMGLVVLPLLSGAWFSRVMQADAGLRPALLNELRRSLTRVSGIVTLGLAFGVPALLTIWAPPSYSPGGLIVVSLLVALSTLMVGLYAASFQALIASGSTLATAIITLAAGAVNLAGNVILVHNFGIDASAAITLTAYVLIATSIVYLSSRRKLMAAPTPRDLYFVMLVAAVAVSSVFLGTSGVGAAVRWSLGAAAFGWLLATLRSLVTHGGYHVIGKRHRGSHFKPSSVETVSRR